MQVGWVKIGHSIANVAGASLSHPDTEGLMCATLKAPIASSLQMLGLIGAASNPDVLTDADTEYGSVWEAGSEVQPTQPPHPPLVDDIPSGYPEVSGDSDTPDIADIYRDFSVYFRFRCRCHFRSRLVCCCLYFRHSRCLCRNPKSFTNTEKK